MRLTILGSSASYAGAGQACSGYLIESDGTRILLDIGNGTLANYGAVADAPPDAVFVTHEHPDHFADLFALQALLRYAPEGPLPPVPVYAPSGLFERAACLLSDRGLGEFREAFGDNMLIEEVTVRVGPFAVTPHLVDHVGLTFALTVECDGRRLCYTADTRSGPAADEAARGADLVLAEATLERRHAGLGPHMTAEEAGRLAANAGADRLVLTHLWPTAPRDQLLEDAMTVFDGEVLLARELLVLEV